MSVHSINNTNETSVQKPYQTRYGVFIVTIAMSIVIIVTVHFLSATGAEIRKAADERRAAAVDKENTSICERWGLQRSSLDFMACATDLENVRGNHERRLRAEFNGLTTD